MTKRRELLTALGLVMLSASFGAFPQKQNKVWRVGYLTPRQRPASLELDIFAATFLQGMRDFGYVEGKNLVIEWRYADGRYERLPDLAADLVRLNADAIVAASSPAVSAAQKATATIPIVMIAVADPVGNGFVKRLSRPEGNITGFTLYAGDISAKHLEILLDILPKLERVALLANPTNSYHPAILKNVQAAALATKTKILPAEASSPEAIDNAFSLVAKQNVGALIVLGDAFFLSQGAQIAALARKHQLASISAFREFTEAGGLISYGENLGAHYRHAVAYVDKILKGVRPGDLPVEQGTTLELVINLKTAKALGITIPQSLLLRADEVIE
jgi:putative tryptophan/tyrosine transport system substrate-binding protein